MYCICEYFTKHEHLTTVVLSHEINWVGLTQGEEYVEQDIAETSLWCFLLSSSSKLKMFSVHLKVTRVGEDAVQFGNQQQIDDMHQSWQITAQYDCLISPLVLSVTGPG